jgi:CRP/FNR family transcriptional regulator
MNSLEQKIKQATLFQNLTNQDIEYLVSISHIKTFYKDNIVFYKGDSPRYLYLLLDGNLKLYKYNMQDNEVVLKIFDEISLVAELASFEQISYPANCMAIDDSTLLLIDYDKFQNHFFNDKKFLLIFMKSLTKKIKTLEEFISTNITLNSSQKVAKYILEREKSFVQNSNIKSAKLLNMAPETFSRVIKKFKDYKIIEKCENRLVIKDAKRLKDILRKK